MISASPPIPQPNRVGLSLLHCVAQQSGNSENTMVEFAVGHGGKQGHHHAQIHGQQFVGRVQALRLVGNFFICGCDANSPPERIHSTLEATNTASTLPISTHCHADLTTQCCLHLGCQKSQLGRNSSTKPSASITSPLRSLSQRPVRSVSLRLPKATTASVTIRESSAM